MGVLGAPMEASGDTKVVPAQFIAKMYTEALGRHPDPQGWRNAVASFQAGGCNAAVLGAHVRAFYTSAEFNSRSYDPVARVLTLYRGALNREPDPTGLAHWTSEVSRLSWRGVVDAFVASAEFAQLIPVICSPASTSYYFGRTPAATLPVTGAGFAGGTGQQLQALLDDTPVGGTVYLAQKAVVRLTAPLTVPSGVTLTTTGRPAPDHYALQGRLVRASMFAGPLVKVSPDATVDSVWIDGQRGSYSNYVQDAINVQTWGSGIRITNSLLTNTAGWSTVQVLGQHEGQRCMDTRISGNLITAYSSDHYAHDGKAHWTDGLTIGCEQAAVVGNSVVDATDVAIVLFHAEPANQASSVRDNVVLSAGNSAYAALAVETGRGTGGMPRFHGAALERNAVWTGPNTHFDIGLAVGSRMWHGVHSDTGTGVSFIFNTTNGLTANVGTGIAITGMRDAVVQENQMSFSFNAAGACPHVPIGIDADGYGDGSIQPGAVAARFVNPATGAGCIGH